MWELAPSGLYVPIPVAAPEPVPEPPAEPHAEFRGPNESERLRHWSGFDEYVEKMDFRPCPRCREPIRQAERHESMCNFKCACGWRANVRSDGTIRYSDKTGVEFVTAPPDR